MRLPGIRFSRSALRGLLTVTAVAALAGCSTDQPVPLPPDPTVEVTADPGSNEATNMPAEPTGGEVSAGAVSETVVCSPDGPPLTPFTGPAVTRFGADAVMDAYCESGAFFVQHAVTNLTDPAAARLEDAGRDLRFVTDLLTVTAAQRMTAVASAAPSPKVQQALSDLTFYRLPLPSGYAYPDGGPMAVGGTVSKAAADVATLPDGRPALALWYSVALDLPVSRGVANRGAGVATHVMPLTRKVALYLVPNPDPQADPDRSWLFESWTTSWKAGRVERWSVGR